MRDAEQSSGWSTIPTPVRILLLSAFAALVWLVFGVAGSASADEAPPPEHSLLGSPLGSVTDLTDALLPPDPAVATLATPTRAISVSPLVTPVAHQVDSLVQALPVVNEVAAPDAVETLTAPVTARVDGLLGVNGLLGGDGLIGNILRTNRSTSGILRHLGSTSSSIPSAASAGASAAITTPSAGSSADTSSAPAVVATRGNPAAPLTPPVPAAPRGSGLVSAAAQSGAAGVGSAATIAGTSPASAGILGRGALPQNDSLPFSLALTPGSSPD